MKVNLKTFAILALVVSVVIVSGCAQQAQNATKTSPSPSAAAQIKSQEQAAQSVVDTSKEVKKISDTLANIDKTLAGK